MNRATALHREAMDLAEQALLAQRRGEYERAQSMFREAFLKEREAASVFASTSDDEPTRSVLFRSAAALAVDCGDLREAERLVAMGLSGNPPEEIHAELRDLYENVTFARHLELQGVTLGSSELQMSLSGDAVGHGMIASGEYLPRIRTVENLVLRTAERRRDLPFREGAKPPKSIRDDFQVFVSVPRAASFAVTIRIGSRHRQKQLFGDSDEVVTEMIERFELFNTDGIRELQDRIDDPAYYRNFVHLMRQLAPDGARIRSVGFTAIQSGTERRVALTHPPSTGWYAGPKPNRKSIRIEGVLTEALKRKVRNVIGIRDAQGKVQIVHVPAGLMNDIVRPLWDREVRVVARQKNGRNVLADIVPLERDESELEAVPQVGAASRTMATAAVG